MKATHYIHDPTTGEILSVFKGKRRHAELNAGSGEVVELKKPEYIVHENHYHKNGSIVDRPVIEVAATATVGIPLVVAGIPSGVDISIDGSMSGASDGTDIELVFDLDGEYEVTLDLPFPFVRGKHKVVVT